MQRGEPMALTFPKARQWAFWLVVIPGWMVVIPVFFLHFASRGGL